MKSITSFTCSILLTVFAAGTTAQAAYSSVSFKIGTCDDLLTRDYRDIRYGSQITNDAGGGISDSTLLLLGNSVCGEGEVLSYLNIKGVTPAVFCKKQNGSEKHIATKRLTSAPADYTEESIVYMVGDCILKDHQ